MNAITKVPTFDITVKMELAIERILNLIRQKKIVISAFSGGKDSSCTTLLMLEAIRRAKHECFPQADHCVTSADTTVENPAMHRHLMIALEEITAYGEENDLPVTIQIATPSLASQFVVSTIGRGTLVRTPENSVKDGAKKRPCADDWKVRPQQKLNRQIAAKGANEGYLEPITLLGNRFEESSTRGTNMASRGENEFNVVRNDDGFLTFSPIADWTVDDVWEMLGMFTKEEYKPFPSALSVRTINRMHDLYRSGNEGVCGVVVGNGGNKAACGSRFGCVTCCISGAKDKSMESMIKDDEHAHLAGINRFRNYMLDTQYDMSKRELVGRSLSKAGYIRIQADVLSFSERINYLRYMLTLDVLEQERAEKHAEDLDLGLIPDTEANRELADIQFEMINFKQLVAIDFMLSMHHYAPHAFPAMSEWYEIFHLGRRYPVPVIDKKVQKVTFERHGWFKVGTFNQDAPTDGLRSYTSEMWNPYRHPSRVSAYAQTTGGDKVCYFTENAVLSVDAVEACSFATLIFDYQMFIEVRGTHAIESARFWLNEEILKLPHGMSQTYQEMAVRGQYFNHLAQAKNLSPVELDKYLVKNAITNAEHEQLLCVDDYPLFSQLELTS